MSDLPLNKVLGALDQKDMQFWERCTPEQQKKIAPFLLNRYMSIVKGSSELHEYYLIATNQRVNVNYFALNKHPKLVWQLLCTVSPGMGNQFHHYKQDELDLLASITTKKELKLLAEASGE